MFHEEALNDFDFALLKFIVSVDFVLFEFYILLFAVQFSKECCCS